MKKGALIVVVVIFALAVAAYTLRDGDVIKIHVTGRDASGLIAEFNSYMAPHSINLQEVDSAWESDITLSFVDDLGGDYGATSIASGNIDIANRTPPNLLLKVLIHELTHAAGNGHESDPASVMNTGNGPWTVSESHIRDLRRLPGITMPERMVAQVRAPFASMFAAPLSYSAVQPSESRPSKPQSQTTAPQRTEAKAFNNVDWRMGLGGILLAIAVVVWLHDMLWVGPAQNRRIAEIQRQERAADDKLEREIRKLGR